MRWQSFAGGVMIWEVGQDNFMNKDKALNKENALLPAITDAIFEARNTDWYMLWCFFCILSVPVR